MDPLLLVPICIHSFDIKTTKNLLCVSKYPFHDINIWKLKFNYEFENSTYLDFWNSYNNYLIRKINNFGIYIQYNWSSREYQIDNLLYEHSSDYTGDNDFMHDSFMMNDFDEIITDQCFYDNVDIQNKILLFKFDTEYWWLDGQYSTIDEAIISKDISFKHETRHFDRNELFNTDIKEFIIDYIVVDVSLMKISLLKLNHKTNKLISDLKEYADSHNHYITYLESKEKLY